MGAGFGAFVGGSKRQAGGRRVRITHHLLATGNWQQSTFPSSPPVPIPRRGNPPWLPSSPRGGPPCSRLADLIRAGTGACPYSVSFRSFGVLRFQRCHYNMGGSSGTRRSLEAANRRFGLSAFVPRRSRGRNGNGMTVLWVRADELEVKRGWRTSSHTTCS